MIILEKTGFVIEALSKFLWPIIIMRLGETLSESPEAIPICLKSLRHLKCLVYLSFPYENKERDKFRQHSRHAGMFLWIKICTHNKNSKGGQDTCLRD